QPQAANIAALQNQIQLGNQMYAPAQAAASNLSNYMGLGQSASQLANAIGSTNFNQAMQTGSGIMQGLGGLNSVFGGGGGGGLFGGSGGGGGLLGSLFGAGASALGPSAAGLFG